MTLGITEKKVLQVITILYDHIDGNHHHKRQKIQEYLLAAKNTENLKQTINNITDELEENYE